MGTFPPDLNVFLCAHPGKQSWSGRVSGLNGWTRSNPIILIPLFQRICSHALNICTTLTWSPCQSFGPWSAGAPAGCRAAAMRGGLQQQLASRRWHFPRCPAYKAWNRGAVRKYFPLKKEGERERGGGGGDTGSIIDGRLIGGVSARTDSRVSGLQADDGSTEAPGRVLSPVLTHRNGGCLNNTSHLSWKTAAAGSDNGGGGCCCHLTVEITRSDVRYLYCYYCYYYFRRVDGSCGWFGCKITVLQNAAFAAGVRGIPAVIVSPAQPDRSPVARFSYLIFFFNHLIIPVWLSDGRGDTRVIDQWSETSVRWYKHHPSGRWLPSTFTLNTF